MQLDQLKRREFIRLLGGAAAWPLAARAQQPMPAVGFLMSARQQVDEVQVALKDAGFVEGRNLAIEDRYADEEYDRLPALAADLVRRKVAVIFSTGSVISPLAAKAATTTIPIVFNRRRPSESGLVASIGRPGGNLTGVNFLTGELAAKRLELLREVVPGASG
jgi:ABC-type uncharacterized transport system substrate-binding protein